MKRLLIVCMLVVLPSLPLAQAEERPTKDASVKARSTEDPNLPIAEHPRHETEGGLDIIGAPDGSKFHRPGEHSPSPKPPREPREPPQPREPPDPPCRPRAPC